MLDGQHACNATGRQALQQQSWRAHRTRVVFAPAQAARVRARVQRRARDFGKPTSRWTLDLAAEVSVAEGIVPPRVSGETIRQPLRRLGIRWPRATHGISSPAPGYARNKGSATA